MANDVFSALRTYLTKVSGGEKTPQEIAAALNTWARESSEAIKIRVEEEIQRSAKKMGFAKQSDLDKLARELEELRFHLASGTRASTASKKSNRATKKKAPARKQKSGVKKPQRKSSPKKK